jgi:hypothetical protein
MCSYVLRAAAFQAARRGAGMLVAVLQTFEEGELPADCVASLCESLNINQRWVVLSQCTRMTE